MKPLLILFIAHLTVCGVVGYLFRERSQEHRDFETPIETTSPDERSRGEASFLLARSHTAITFPGPVLLYGAVGPLALLVAFGIELYRHFTHA